MFGDGRDCRGDNREVGHGGDRQYVTQVMGHWCFATWPSFDDLVDSPHDLHRSSSS